MQIRFRLNFYNAIFIEVKNLDVLKIDGFVDFVTVRPDPGNSMSVLCALGFTREHLLEFFNKKLFIIEILSDFIQIVIR